jgi:hypothetical protein
MYSVAAKTAHFEIVRHKGFTLHQLHALLLPYKHQNFKIFEHLKAAVCTINCSYASLQQCFQALIFGGKYILQFW